MKLKQVGANNYTCIQFRLDPVKKGEVIEVADDLGAHLLEQKYLDIAKNAHPYFELVAEEAAPAKPKRRARKKVATKPAEPVEAAETETEE